MAEKEYEIIEVKGNGSRSRSLVIVETPNRQFTASLLPFGPNSYPNNVAEMSQSYLHPRTGKTISFLPATTSQSVFLASNDFPNRAKPQIFDREGLQVGKIVRTNEGVFFNTWETDKTKLKALIDAAEKVNGIYLGKNDFAYTPYETFNQGVWDSGDFAESGLTRAMEHVRGNSASNLREISSTNNYSGGVSIRGFEPVSEPVKRFVILDSDRCFGNVRLVVDGGYWDAYYGYAFGVLNVAEGDGGIKVIN